MLTIQLPKSSFLALCFFFFYFFRQAELAAQTCQPGNFNQDWEFVKDINTTVTPAFFRKTNKVAVAWQWVSLPHTAQLDPLFVTGNQRQGTCFSGNFLPYRQVSRANM